MNSIFAITKLLKKQGPGHVGIQEQRLLWLIRIRFIALFCQLPLTFVGKHYGYLTESSHLFFIAVTVALIIYNVRLCHKIIVERMKSSKLHLTLQMTADLILFTILLSVSGSSNNPFYAFFYAIAVMGGIFSTGPTSIIFGFVLMGCIFFIQTQPLFFTPGAFEITFLPETFPYLLSQLLIPFVTFLIAKSFGDLLDSSQEKLLSMTVHSERTDRLRALGSLSAGFSHEFASPLQNVKLRLNRISKSRELNSEDIDECLLSIGDCEKVLKKMNLSQLNFSDLELEKLEITQIIEDSVSSWRQTMPEFSVKLELQEALVRIHRLNFVQSLFNLLDNAAEASASKKEITIKVERELNKVSLSVIDQGLGFGREIIDRFGEPFNTNKQGGTGLGLYSTNLFMISTGGELCIKKNGPQGSIVQMIFPEPEVNP